VMFVAVMALECHFTRLFLDLKSAHLRIYHLLGLCSGLCLLLMGMLLFSSSAFLNQLSLTLAFLLVPIQMAAILLRWQEKMAALRWMLASSVSLVIVCIVFLLSSVTQLPLASTYYTECLWLLTLGALMLLPAQWERQQQQSFIHYGKDKRIAVAEAETRAKNEFLTQLSHEIRTPMNGILGMTELLEETPLSPTQLDYVKTIASSGNHLLNIIDDILDYSKIEAGKMSLDVSIFDLASMLNECLEMFKLRAEEKSLELVSLINSDVPTQVKGDPLRIRQVVANLVSNAIKFTENGEVMITVSNDENTSPRHIRFEIRDTGAGIAKEKLKQLLLGQDPDDKSGTGLGLAIAQQLVKMMGGQMGASSQPGRGSAFWFSIPLEAVAEDSANSPFFTEQLQGLRMLVVDDNASCRLVIQQQAASWGMQVTTAVNGKQAMALLRTQANLDEPFDVVILDHDMPGMNGLELAAKLKEDPLINNNLLVLMLTGHGNAPTATAARNAGVRRIITKPVTGRILKITLAEELGHLRKIQASALPLNEQELVQLSQLRVLIAEDHPLSQKVINGMMHRLDVNAKLVVNGVQAVEEARRGNYDLILMDCDMPEMDGFEATRRIRQWEAQNKRTPMPIIALTAHIMDEHKERSLACGMNAHLSKPVELSELRDTMLRWASSGKSPNEPRRRLG
jgi:signal transduction histidine kinase/DNA-binding response OmpR family regulator